MICFSQGESSRDPHTIEEKMSLQQVPNIMRAIGFYPTEEEVQNLINEVKSNQNGQDREEINFEDLIKCI